MDNTINNDIIQKAVCKSVAIYKAIAMLPPPEIKDLWAENNYTKQNQNNSKQDEKDNCVTTNEIKNVSTKNDLNDITKRNKCLKCNIVLVGKQTKYCSLVCKNRHTNSWHNTAERQYKRGVLRKQKLIDEKGGGCARCGYTKLHALSFHHIEPSKKSFQLDIRHLTNRSWKVIKQEAEKCELLCLNCHAEIEWMGKDSNYQKLYVPNKVVGPAGLEPTTQEL